MVIVQENKQKVRPIMDCCEHNEHVDTYMAGADVCAHKLREWQQQGVGCHSVRSALSLHTNTYWKITVAVQTVEIKGTRYYLTQLGFSLNVAPSIMTAIMNVVRVQDENVQKAASSYIDDIFVNECIVSSQVVKKHFEHFGSTCKEPEPHQNGAKVLGLHISSNGERLRWRKGSDTPEVPLVITCWSTFSVCGKLAGHFPVCGWLREAVVAKNDMQRLCHQYGTMKCEMLPWQICWPKTMARLTQNDPVRGDWCINGNEFTIWVDASSLAMRVTLVANSAIVKDACWLWPENDAINLAELYLALQWQARVLPIVTDSVCKHQWITDPLTGKARLNTKASSEMLIWRWLAMMPETIKKYNFFVDVALIRLAMNKADVLRFCHHHHHVVPLARISLTLSLATSPYRSSPLAGLQGYILYRHIAAVCSSWSSCFCSAICGGR